MVYKWEKTNVLKKSSLTLLNSSVLQVPFFLNFSSPGPPVAELCPGHMAVVEGASLSKHSAEENQHTSSSQAARGGGQEAPFPIGEHRSGRMIAEHLPEELQFLSEELAFDLGL